MAQRTTIDDVKDVLLDNYDTVNNPSLQPFIDIASMMTDRIEACALESDPPVTLTADELEMIERWLTAHYYAQTDRVYSSKSTDGASGAYAGQTGMYFTSTPYGQAAIGFDASGCLAEIEAGVTDPETPTEEESRTASGYWLGKRPSQQIPYRSRD